MRKPKSTQLTQQELRVAKLAALGYSKKSSQEILDIGPETLRTYEFNISCKTNLPRACFWMVFQKENKHFIPPDDLQEPSSTIMPLGVLEIDKFNLEITVDRKFKST